MSKPTEKAEREQFEKWSKEQFGGIVPGMWTIWRAAWRAGAEDMRAAVLEKIASVTGPTGGWLVSPKKLEDFLINRALPVEREEPR
jgi:hypothetical protein